MISIYHSLYPTGYRTGLQGISSYSHETVLVGGYLNASFSFSTSNQDAEQWLLNGVGRHIETYSRRGNKIWEGIVNEVSINTGSHSIKIGPLLNVSNKINVGFQHPNYNIPGDTQAGTYDETGWDGRLQSQYKYGVLEEFISGGTGEIAEMDTLRESRLEKQDSPGISETMSSGSANDVLTITVSCIGYFRILEKQVYNLVWASGMELVDLSTKVHNILDANLFFVNRRAIIKNVQVVDTQVPREDNNNRTAWGIISDHIAKSSITDGIKCGMGDDLSFMLYKVGYTITYKRETGSGKIVDINGAHVENSEVVPGGYMSMTDFATQVSYRITSIKYNLDSDTVNINFQDSSLKTILSNAMLGGFQ